ncbi:MAG: hypothetical protein K0S55_749 [Clostridia bacterium]|nr:hypothetical protein [Clostridia bacterium]
MNENNILLDKFENPLFIYSLLEDYIIIKKLNEESKFFKDNIILKELVKEINNLCVTIRNEGFWSLSKYIDKFNCRFFTNICYILIQPEQPSRSIRSLPALMQYCLKPILISNDFRGIEFIKAILLYEGVLMTIGGLEPKYFNLRLNGIIGNEIDIS